MDELHRLRWSDIWLLVSVYLCSLREHDRLRDAVAAADAMNHAVMNHEELSSGLVRLEEHGLITVQDNHWRIRCTQKGREIVEPVAKQNSLSLRIWQEVEKRLGVQPWMPREPIPHPENTLRYPGFSKENYEAAVAEYLSTMK